MIINSFRDLVIWQKAVSLSIKIYKSTETFPRSEIFGLVSQLRRSSVSIPSNIAEGRYRSSKKDFANFLRIAYGSCAESETQLLISKELNFLDEKGYNVLIADLTEVSKILNVMIRKLNL